SNREKTKMIVDEGGKAVKQTPTGAGAPSIQFDLEELLVLRDLVMQRRRFRVAVRGDDRLQLRRRLRRRLAQVLVVADHVGEEDRVPATDDARFLAAVAQREVAVVVGK